MRVPTVEHGNARNQAVWFVREALIYNIILSKFLSELWNERAHWLLWIPYYLEKCIHLLFLIVFLYSCFISTFAATGSVIGGDEIIAGNVNKYTVLPTGYSGQPKKGHLVFDACFESGKHFQYYFVTKLSKK